MAPLYEERSAAPRPPARDRAIFLRRRTVALGLALGVLAVLLVAGAGENGSPFKAAIEAGVTAVIQPGGSRRDPEVIDACNRAGVAMVFTGRRHFRH